MKNRIYIAGGGGMLGEAFYKVFSEDSEVRVTDIDVNEPWIDFIDFRDFPSYENDVVEFDPQYLFHLGAHTSLEYCEENPDDAYLTNTLSVENAVRIANRLKVPLLYISTAGIFDGGQDTYDDWDLPNPLGHYARSKYMGERFVVENKDEYLVCRAGWMMGGGPNKDKKFVNKILRQIKDGKRTIDIVNDKFGTPTYTHDFARNVKELIQARHWGVYNLVCEGVTSRLDVTRELIRLLDLESRVEIREVTSDHFREEYYAPRPASERLLNTKLNLRGLNHMRNWKICLKEYLENYFVNYFDRASETGNR
jgi:dTDP-4-dehydrorhamnose reductase